VLALGVLALGILALGVPLLRGEREKYLSNKSIS
jgi:hypothetical protein